jgi:nucleotide-binding universal stress UspA family protein
LLEDTEEHVSRMELGFSPTVESSKTHHIPTDFQGFQRILVAYDGMKMSKISLRYATYISKISDSEIVLINVIKAHRSLINVLPVTIVTNLHKEIDIAASHREGVLQDKFLLEVIEEMTTACRAAGITKKTIFKIYGGNPADEIINLTNLMQFDLIVMGSRRIASMIEGLGSTARKVAATCKVPLLIIQKQPRYKDEW